MQSVSVRVIYYLNQAYDKYLQINILKEWNKIIRLFKLDIKWFSDLIILNLDYVFGLNCKC